MDDFSKNVDFLSNKFGRIFVVFLTMNSLTKDLDICFQIDWKNVFSSLLSMKVSFKVIVCICNQKSFINLLITL
jgi:hypothetical protein